MVDTKRIVAAALALVFSLMVFVVPAGAEEVSYTQPYFLNPGATVNTCYASTETYKVYNPGTEVIYVGVIGSSSANAGATIVASTIQNYTYKAGWDDPTGTYNCSSHNNNISLYVYWHEHGGYTENNQMVPSDVPVFSNATDFIHSVEYYIENPPSSGPAAELVDAGNSFAFSSDYTINNTSDIDIAVATYNIGYNDIIVACSYETLVLPGTIAGMSGNYNISSTLPRDQHIPVRYTSVVSDTTFSSLSPFDSLEDAVSACYSILQDSPNHGGGYTPTVTSFTLQPGNVAYIEMADLTQSIDLGATFSQYSAMFATSGSYFPGNTLYKTGVDYPQEGDVLPGATANQIPWQKNEWGEENILGQTKVGFASISASSNLVMIYNPYYRGDDTSTVTNPTNINPAIVIISSGIARNGIRVYSLKDSFSAVDGNYYYGIGSTSPTGFGDYSQSQNNPNADDPSITGWTDQDGNPTTAPGVTPYNSPPENESLSDVLTGFFNNITGIFTEGHDAIKNLVESSSEFTSRLSSLYAWLPAPVYSVLMSAIILAIIVGVLKVFL